MLFMLRWCFVNSWVQDASGLQNRVGHCAHVCVAEQVFDKALGEPGFSGVYARICYDLNQVLPSFKVLDEEGREEEVEFRRVLLNKCQSEFEEGGAAMRAVEAREKRQREEDAAKVGLRAGRLRLHPIYLCCRPCSLSTS